ncbi:ArnT family glycosyltransferase [Pseudofrankia saprophytica]|uniref:ArnT family glycosyltransferase n=1 Tax=Pseudofrankia saprophytica TaxID=298655 RepID=UPI000234C1A8|nr:glycosyltransferase family 39 protein [Pseudofrankia saprophytica]
MPAGGDDQRRRVIMARPRGRHAPRPHPRAAGAGTDPLRTGNRRLWWVVLALIVLAALGVRLWYLFHWLYPMKIAGDAYYYHHAANMFADGRGWPLPSALLNDGEYVPYAQHPPMTSMLLAIPSVLGRGGFADHQVFLCGIGALSVLVVGLAGRRIAGPVTGLVAAAIAAVYPGMWLPDPLVMSETPGILTCALLVLATYRLYDRRRPLDVVWVGLALAATMLTRAELALLALILVTPFLLRLPALSWRRRFGYLGLAAATSAVAIGPWVGYNLSRFEHPVYIENGLGVTLAVTQCDDTYYGDLLGWWMLSCTDPFGPPPKEASESDLFYQDIAFAYIGSHEKRLPVVAAARLGRTWAVYRPWQQARLDVIEERPLVLSEIATVSLWCLTATGVGGLVVLRRRRVPVLPLVAAPLALSVASAMIYGTTRFRAVGEPSVVLLAAVAVGALVGRRARRVPDVPDVHGDRDGRDGASAAERVLPVDDERPPFPSTGPHRLTSPWAAGVGGGETASVPFHRAPARWPPPDGG